MKKLLLAVILMIYAVQIFAQNPTAESYLGLKAGAGPTINFVSDSSLDDYDIKYKLGFGGGLYYNIPLGKRFSVQPELVFSQMGSKLESAQEENSAKLELSYFAMPFLIKFNPVNRLVFFAGPQLSFIVNAKINYESRTDVDVLSQLNSFDPAVVAGLEYWITRNIGIYASNLWGLGNLNGDNPGIWLNNEFVTANISNFAFQLGLTLGFPTGPSASDDADGDSIPDKVDKCPNVRGSADNRGCPEMVLHYKNDDATLDSVDKSNLDIVVNFLKNNPKLKITIEGHTSTVGETDYNQALSEKRVNASLDYLVSKGISKKRMQAIGYGEQYPIGDNETEMGRAESRRVVIRIAKD